MTKIMHHRKKHEHWARDYIIQTCHSKHPDCAPSHWTPSPLNLAENKNQVPSVLTHVTHNQSPLCTWPELSTCFEWSHLAETLPFYQPFPQEAKKLDTADPCHRPLVTCLASQPGGKKRHSFLSCCTVPHCDLVLFHFDVCGGSWPS